MMLPHCESCGNDLPKVTLTYVRLEQYETELKIDISGYHGTKANIVFQGKEADQKHKGFLGLDRKKVLCPICKAEVNVNKYGWEMAENGHLFNIDSHMEELL